jgi:cytochrome c oxidase cbb3-type subunit 3
MNTSIQRISVTAGLPFAALLLISFNSSCEREERGFRVDPPSADTVKTVTLSTLHPGIATQPSTTRPAAVINPYENNAYAMAEGQRLFNNFNCSGCHANGGGGMGPPLIDDTWIYGSEPDQVFSTIVQGRPNGMPSFMGRIADAQVWQLVSYVRSMGGLAAQDAAPGRADHMKDIRPPNSADATPPQNSVVPKSAEQP